MRKEWQDHLFIVGKDKEIFLKRKTNAYFIDGI